jgi:outer membrane protein assembly factor BamA
VLETVSYNIDAGRSTQLGSESDLVEIWYVRPGINWKIIKDWSCTTRFFYEHGKEGVGNIIGNSTENYDYYGGDLALNHELTKNITMSATYRLTMRSSDEEDNGYTQNLIGLRLTYHPK